MATIKASYNPETKYITEIKQMTNGDMRYIAPENVLQRLKEKGVANPTPIHTESHYKTVLRTGKLRKDGNFPLTMFFIDISGMFKGALPDDMVIHGHSTQNQLPVLDSVVSEKVDYAYKKELLKGMKDIFSQLSIPEKTTRIGESFVIDFPLNMPIGGRNIEMLIHCTYTLNSIANEIAEYNIITEYTLKSGTESNGIRAKGNGTGRLEYDLKNNFNKRYEVSSELELSMILEQISIELKMTIGQVMTITIEND
jgi:hypothetical protein